MSFINNISCYFILEKKIDDDGEISGVISESYDLAYIINIDPNFIQSDTSIITGYPFGSNTKFIVGIPNNNGNNLSKKEIMNAMIYFNIHFLRSIRPYVKSGGNEVTVPNTSNCITAKERKELTLKYKNFGNINELNKKEIRGIINNLGLANRVCLNNTNYY